MHLNRLNKIPGKILYRAKGALNERNYQEIASKYDFNGFKRIYFVHIRKTGGTSLNNMFFALSCEDTRLFYKQLSERPDHRLVRDNKIYVGWNSNYVKKGNFFYAFSHKPFYKLELPKNTFTFSCFRDPVKRVISHYNMLMGYENNEAYPSWMDIERKWLGGSFRDYLIRIPKKHLLNQLYMFSSNYDVDEAIKNVKQLSYFFFTENFNEGIQELNNRTSLKLVPMHIRKAKFESALTEEDKSKLQNLLEKEYVFLNRLQELVNN